MHTGHLTDATIKENMKFCRLIFAIIICIIYFMHTRPRNKIYVANKKIPNKEQNVY